MRKRATGHVRWVNGVAIARIRITSDLRVSLPMPHCSTAIEAAERSAFLAALAKRMRTAGCEPMRARKALEIVATASARSLRNAQAVVEELVGGQLGLESGPATPTFKQIGDDWTSGKLAARYPDQIRVKRSVDDDTARLRIHVYPVLQDIPIDRVTLDHAEEVMRRIPPTFKAGTRRNIGQLITRILAMAVYPLRLIERSPIPRGFLPSAGKPKALAYLYPDEDRRLMACAKVPIAYRMLWGFLIREGMREGEALELTWIDLDLERGAVRLERNKTDDPRAWALDAGVAAALRVYRERYRPNAEPSSRVFLDPDGHTIAGSGALGLPALLRAHLLEIGLLRERPELFTSTTERQRMRVHDLRGTFVTVSLANGKSESWISDRTGHRSSQMINRYKRTARTFTELHLGALEPLIAAIPELASASSWAETGASIGHGLATTSPKYAKEAASPAGFEPASPT